MIRIKSAHEVKLMQEAGRIAAEARALCGRLAQPGITTGEIDDAARKLIVGYGAKPSFLGYSGFPGSICCSLNDEVIHGIPGSRKLREGDIVKIDVGANYMGYHGDCAATFPVGQVSEEAMKLILVTRQSFYEGIKFARAGMRISDIARAVQQHNESCGFSLVREYVGHGIGSELHEAPEVPNFVTEGRRGPRLMPGMTIAIEPMVNMGAYHVTLQKDGWTVKTADGRLSAHYENTVLITDSEPVILTACAAGESESDRLC